MTKPLYDTIGSGYANLRRADPRIAAAIADALGDAQTVINIGAGAGSYEPPDRTILAIEPSMRMIVQRPQGAAPCVSAVAQQLPVKTAAVDAAMASLTIHHWPDWRAGLAEMRRIAHRRVVLFSFDAGADLFWLTRDYAPAIAALDRKWMPRIDEMAAALGPCRVTPVPVPHDCTDGFLGAYWRRPEAYLDANLRSSMSSFSLVDAAAGLEALGRDLTSGAWAKANAGLLKRDALDIGYRLLTWDFT
ncbi:MAG: methyltransferase domain-containing protein [Alphaproteobacteria bacterium]|nr:methyltransferase domain-containing protein [Alphaproteobacteria bacterium]